MLDSAFAGSSKERSERDELRITPNTTRGKVAHDQRPRADSRERRIFQPPCAAIAFQIKGKVPQVCPRCCGQKPKRTTRPLPSLASAIAIRPLILSSPSSHPDLSTFSLA